MLFSCSSFAFTSFWKKEMGQPRGELSICMCVSLRGSVCVMVSVCLRPCKKCDYLRVCVFLSLRACVSELFCFFFRFSHVCAGARPTWLRTVELGETRWFHNIIPCCMHNIRSFLASV